MSAKYTKAFARFTETVTVDVCPTRVHVNSHTTDLGHAPVDRRSTDDPERLAREIGDDLLADGYARDES